MGNILYFFPGLQGKVEEAIKEMGLGWLLEDARPAQGQISGQGPGGKSGALMAIWALGAKSGDFAVAYKPEKQRWISVDGGKYWIGYYKNNPPKPEALARKKQMFGQVMTLADGNEWVIPFAVHKGVCAFESRIGLSDEGQEAWTVLDKYEAFSAALNALSQAIGSGEGKGVPLDHFTALAVEALALNYRVSRTEVAALGLLTTANQLDVINAAMDSEFLMTANSALGAGGDPEKKSDSSQHSDGRTSTSGEPGE